jgi:ATP-dependent phosphofructokinase / diphosphate-dependent phosphofructokinase
LGHLQRGGSPSPADRVLATCLGAKCAEMLSQGVHGMMVAARGYGTALVPLEEVAGKKKLVPTDQPWIESARLVGVSFGD